MGENFSYENMSIRCISKLDFHTYIQRTLVLEKVTFLILEMITLKYFYFMNYKKTAVQ